MVKARGLLSIRHHKNFDIFIMLGLTLLTSLLVILAPSWQAPIRIILGFLVVLIVPGYILTSLLFPQKDDIDGVERLALSLGLSIAVIPLIGLILDKTPWGINLTAIALSIALFVILFSGFTLLRRTSIPIEKRYYSPLDNPEFRHAFGSITLIIAFFVGLIIFGLSLKPEEKFTEFYLLGPEGKLENYPTELLVNERFGITIGIANHEKELVKYRIHAPFQNKSTTTISTAVTLNENGVWEKELMFLAPKETGQQKLVFELYREGASELYRSTHIFVDILP